MFSGLEEGWWWGQPFVRAISADEGAHQKWLPWSSNGYAVKHGSSRLTTSKRKHFISKGNDKLLLWCPCCWMLCYSGKKRSWIRQVVMLTQGEDDEIGCGLQLRKSVHKLLFARSCWITLGAPFRFQRGEECVCGNCWNQVVTWCDLISLLIVLWEKRWE